MRITIVAPIGKVNTGNRMTARRWAKMLKSLGHRVQITPKLETADSGDQNVNDGNSNVHAPDILIALHARRSAKAIRDFRRQFPTRPIVLALTGTDLYNDIKSSKQAQHSLELADRMILLQPRGVNELPARLRKKCRVIFQSESPPTTIPKPIKRYFEVSVIGNLRPVKDPFRTAMAARKLPTDSRIRVVHIGAALTENMRKRAVNEMAINPRYQWIDSLPHAKTMQRLGRSRLMVLSSKLEGGAHVIGEAAVVKVPIVCSRISGSVGLLGEKHPGYFEVGDTQQLTHLLYRAETEACFLSALQRSSAAAARLFHPAMELNSLQRMIGEL